MRRLIPFLVTLFVSVVLIIFVWQVFPDLLLGSGAENALDRERETAGEEIGAAIFYSFVWALIAAFLLGIAWALLPMLGHSRAVDDAAGASKIWHWRGTLFMVLLIGIIVYWWNRSGMVAVPADWVESGFYYSFELLALAVAAYAFLAVTQTLSAPHMRRSIPWGVAAHGGGRRRRDIRLNASPLNVDAAAQTKGGN